MSCCVVVNADEVKLVESCGKFDFIAHPGFHCVAWPCAVAVGQLSTRVKQLDVNCDTKTKDSVFVTVRTSIQYEVDSSSDEQIYAAYYRLTNCETQMTAYVFDSVRSTLPNIKLDDIFEQKEEIANVVQADLFKTMPGYGYKIITVLVNDIDIERKVKAAMNEINTNVRLRAAATEKAEADKILVVKAAEADAESKYLQGVGISRQRQAIVSGLRDSVLSFTGEVGDVSPKDVLNLMLMTQYFDMLKDVGSQSSVVFIPHQPGSVEEIGVQMRQAMLESGVATKALTPGNQNMTRK